MPAPERYRCFTRTWWIRNPSWPNGREPGAGPRKYHGKRETWEDAAWQEGHAQALDECVNAADAVRVIALLSALNVALMALDRIGAAKPKLSAGEARLNASIARDTIANAKRAYGESS